MGGDIIDMGTEGSIEFWSNEEFLSRTKILTVR